MNISSAFLIFTSDPALWGRLVVRVTGRRLPDRSDAWSHVAIGFGYNQFHYGLALISPCEVYFENLLTRGFRGPHPISKLSDWVARDPRRVYRVFPLPLTPSQANTVHDCCTAWAGVVRRGYNAPQLAALWAAVRFGCPVPRSPTRGICSEDVARLLHPILDLREPGQSFDHCDPNSVYRRYLAIASQVATSAASPDFQRASPHA